MTIRSAAVLKSFNDRSVEVRPIPNTDEAAEVRGAILGTIPVGIFVEIVASLSEITWRFLKISVFSSKMIVITDRPGMDWDRIVSMPIVPPKFFSIGCVTKDSTRPADKPGDSVCIITWVGENSGKTLRGLRVI